jgi:FixJ family two-component response regulator
MPGLSGIEFLNFVKQLGPDIPIVAMTAYSASDEDIGRAVPWIKKGDIVHKPFKALEICDAVKKTLKMTS